MMLLPKSKKGQVQGIVFGGVMTSIIIGILVFLGVSLTAVLGSSIWWFLSNGKIITWIVAGVVVIYIFRKILK